MKKLKLSNELVDPAELIEAEINPNKMIEEEFKDLVNRMKDYGEPNVPDPIFISKDNIIIGGHHRVKAALELEWKTIRATRVLNDLTKAERMFLQKQHNKHGNPDDKLLKEYYAELQLISDLESIKYELETDEDELRKLFPEEITEDEVPETPKESRIKKGDIIELGNHRLMCGDSTVKADVDKLMDGKKADMVFTDPPYNVDYNQDKSPTGKPLGSKGTIMNDKMSSDEFKEFLDSFIKNAFFFNNGVFYIFMGNKEWTKLIKIFEENGGHWSSTIIWSKDSFVLSRQDYHRQYEPILYGWKEGTSHYFTEDRTQSDIWNVSRNKVNDLHPTMKPVELMSKAINNSSKYGMIVLDCFAGSGSTLIACEQLGRISYNCEIDPLYCDVIITRYCNFTGNNKIRINGEELKWQ